MKIESIINYFDRESVGATEFRRLFANIRKTNKDGLKSVMVTSSGVEEGKSTVSSFLALSVAESTNNKVLLLDTDLRRPMVNVLFKMPLEKGFSDLLEKNYAIKETIKETPVQGLSIITAGRLTTEPT